MYLTASLLLMITMNVTQINLFFSRTCVNGSVIHQRTRVRHGDRIVLGEQPLVYLTASLLLMITMNVTQISLFPGRV